MNSELSAEEANRLFYRDLAEDYDATEACYCIEAERDRLRAALKRAIELTGPDPAVLDAGGGTGNAASLLLGMGLEPMVLDISPHMLGRWERKAQELGHAPRTELGTIEGFLSADDRHWNLIIFSSVLHHLEDPIDALLAAGARLEPGGIIVTMFDPTRSGRPGQMLRKIDWRLWAVLHYPRKIPGLIASRIKRLRQEHDPELEVGRRAERYALRGLDDREIVDRVRAAGLEVVAHERTYSARYALIRLAFRLARFPSSFSLTLRRASGLGLSSQNGASAR